MKWKKKQSLRIRQNKLPKKIAAAQHIDYTLIHTQIQTYNLFYIMYIVLNEKKQNKTKKTWKIFWKKTHTSKNWTSKELAKRERMKIAMKALLKSKNKKKKQGE